MTNATMLIDGYITAWNETDPARRRDLIARIWTEDARYDDPMLSSRGHTEINAMTEAVQVKYPDHRFRRTGDVELHHDRARFTWSLAPEGGPALVQGTDFAVITEGRLSAVTGFFDQVPAA
jgi:hypothetical protein